MPPVFVELACISIKIDVNGSPFFERLSMISPFGLSSPFSVCLIENLHKIINQ